MTENLYFNIIALAREVATVAENTFVDLGLTPSEALLILVVNEKDETQPSDISERISLAPSTITRMIEKMEARNIVSRRHEGKYTFVSSTEKGKNLNAALVEKWAETQLLFRSILGDSLVNSLNKASGSSITIFRKKK